MISRAAVERAKSDRDWGEGRSTQKMPSGPTNPKADKENEAKHSTLLSGKEVYDARSS